MSNYYCVVQYKNLEDILPLLASQFPFPLTPEFEQQLLIAIRTRPNYKGRGFAIVNLAAALL